MEPRQNKQLPKKLMENNLRVAEVSSFQIMAYLISNSMSVVQFQSFVQMNSEIQKLLNLPSKK